MFKRRGAARRDEWNRKHRAGERGYACAQRELDLSAQAAGFAIDKSDTVAAVFRQMALGVADDEQVAKQRQPHGPEVATVDVLLQGVGGVVVLALDHLLDVHDRDVAAPAVLQKLGVVDRAVMVDYVRGLPVFADDDVGRIAERPAVKAIERYLRAADDGVRRVVVFRAQGLLQVDGVHARVSATRDQDERFKLIGISVYEAHYRLPFQHFDVGGYHLGLLLRRILGRLLGRSGSLRSQEYHQQDN
jgi:hypothetical protein